MSDVFGRGVLPALDAPLPLVGRRRVLAGGAAIAATGLVQGFPRAAASATDDLVYFDLSYIHQTDLSDERARKDAYDQLHLVFTLQGIVNRRGPRLWVNFITADQFGPTRIDEYWYGLLRADSGLLAGRNVTTVDTLEGLVDHFFDDLDGAVVWDTMVPATSNIASTVAGADDLVALRWDASSGSVYSRFTSTDRGDRRLRQRVWLVSKDGSPLFTGRGRIPGTRRKSTGSAKGDAHIWALEHYLKTGKSNPRELGFFLDSYWLNDWTATDKDNIPNASQQSVLSNHDYLIAHRGFFFDLHVFDDETPIDDRSQPLGTDLAVLLEILHTAYDQAGGEMICVSGFTPWPYKYTFSADSHSKYHPVATEWRLVQVVSAFNAYVEADAVGFDAMANASVFSHQRLQASYPQDPAPTVADLRARGLIADGEVAPKRYLAYYVGDYDSPAWMYHAMPRFWDHPRRGEIALNWAFNPNLGKRFPVGMERTRETRTSNDFFIAGDSGAGYVAPGMLEYPRPISGLPDGLSTWRRFCAEQYKWWDLTITGFILDGLAPGLTKRGFAAYASFSPDGIAGMKTPVTGLIGSTPVLKQADIPRIAPEQAAQSYRGRLAGDLSKLPEAAQYYVGRSVLVDPGWHVTVRDTLVASAPEAGITVIDAPTLFALMRFDLHERVSVSPLSTRVAHDTTSSIVLELLNGHDRRVIVDVQLDLPDGWRHTSVRVDLPAQQARSVVVPVTPPASASVGQAVRVALRTDDGSEQRRRALDIHVVGRSYATAASVEVRLGASNVSAGLEQREGGFDGVSTADIVVDRPCRRIVVRNNGFTDESYLYFKADTSFGVRPEGVDLVAVVEYFDEPGHDFEVEYDGVDGPRQSSGVYTRTGPVRASGIKAWRSTQLILRGARLTGRQPGGPDLRAFGFADLRIASRRPVAIARIILSRA